MAGWLLCRAGEFQASLEAHGAALVEDMTAARWSNVRVSLSNISDALNCQLCFAWGNLAEVQLDEVEQLTRTGKNRLALRRLHGLRGEWRLEREEWSLAVESLHDAVRMAREVGKTDERVETLLALAKLQLGQLSEPRHEAEHLARMKEPFQRGLAELWLAIGDASEAKRHALLAYEEAWADGEPYVHRHELNRARKILERLGATVPELPAYDPAKYERFFWEEELVAAIAGARAAREAESE